MLVISGTLTPLILNHSPRVEGRSLSSDLEMRQFPSTDQLDVDV